MGRIKRLLAIFTIVLLVCGCSAKGESSAEQISADGKTHPDIGELKLENSDIFAWIRIPDTGIDYPVLQSMTGDDSFYKEHNYLGQQDSKGAIYIEAANLTDMCDFNEVLHGSAPEDGTMFASLENYLDKAYFYEHPYIYVYLDGNVLTYSVFAAFARENERLLAQYDFSYASGCRAFLREISEKSMNKIVLDGWEEYVNVDNFLITLSTEDELSGKQMVVVGCLIGDAAGKIDRFVDYSG